MLVNWQLKQFGLFTVPNWGTMGLLSLHPGTMGCQPGDNEKQYCHCPRVDNQGTMKNSTVIVPGLGKQPGDNENKY